MTISRHPDARLPAATRRFAFGLLLGAALAPWPAAAQSSEPFPTRPVRIVVPFPAGGATDVLLRNLAGHMEKTLGQPVVVEPRPGGNMLLAPAFVAKSPPDGHTLMLSSNPFLTNAAVYRSLPYDTVRDFVPVAVIGEQSFALVASSALGVSDVAGLLALARSRPNGLNYGTVSTGGASHLPAVRMEQQAGVRLTQVPYKGGPQILNDMVAGLVDFTFTDLGGALPFVQDGRLKVLAQTGAQRSPAMPGIPAVAETPGLAGFEFRLHLMVSAPAATPRPVLLRLNSALRGAIAQERGAARAGSTMDYLDTPLEEAARYFERQLALWTEATRQARIPLQD
jgi:tripartite-type tricarboxylate transporter receptor subunit TctC